MNPPVKAVLNANAMLNRLTRERILPILRAKAAEDAYWTALLILCSGFDIVEIPWTVPDTDEVIARLREARPDAVIGAGTVLTVAQAEASLAAGAAFLVSPVLDPALLGWGAEHDTLVLPGVMTPTEIYRAMTCGARVVKFFPAEMTGGAAFVRAIRSLQLPVEIIPTGGIQLEHLTGYWEAGCPAVGVGGPMLPEVSIRDRDEAALCQRIQAYLDRRDAYFQGLQSHEYH